MPTLQSPNNFLQTQSNNKNHSRKIFGVAVILVAVILFGLGAYLGWLPRGGLGVYQKGQVIRDTVEIPRISAIRGDEALYLSHSSHPIPIVPEKAEGIVVEGAEQTIRGAYNLAAASAGEWSSDAKLVFIKSLGSIAPDGRSSHWQIAFGSEAKKSGFVAIVRGSAVISEGEALSGENGYDLPENWYDSPDAIASLSGLPQFASSTITAMSFYYNRDDKKWRYAIGTSRGNTSMIVK